MADFEPILEEFAADFIQRISTTYSENIFNTIHDSVKGVIDFNNIAMLKKGQRYVKHTDLIFNKSVARMIMKLLINKGYMCTSGADRYGRCVTIKDMKRVVHFFPLTQIATFPKVPWYNDFVNGTKMNPSGVTQLYVVLIKNDKDGCELINKINSETNGAHPFTTLEQFVRQYLSNEHWTKMATTLNKIENDCKKYKWFELVDICSEVNLNIFYDKVSKELISFDFETILKKSGIAMTSKSFELIYNNFVVKKGYQLLLDKSTISDSFLESEWLFKNYFFDDKLNKTYVVAGYLKSVEQLLWTLIKDCGISQVISKLGKKGITEIDINSNEFFNVTIGNMMFYMKSINNQGMYIEGLKREDVIGIFTILNNWLANSRNGYFHKHNIGEINVVKEIREQTLLLYFLLIGSIKKQ